MFLEPTTDFAYVRLHGAEELYVERVRRRRRWTGGPAQVARLAGPGRDVVVYFDNDVKVRAPFDAQALAPRLGVTPHR